MSRILSVFVKNYPHFSSFRTYFSFINNEMCKKIYCVNVVWSWQPVNLAQHVEYILLTVFTIQTRLHPNLNFWMVLEKTFCEIQGRLESFKKFSDKCHVSQTTFSSLYPFYDRFMKKLRLDLQYCKTINNDTNTIYWNHMLFILPTICPILYYLDC